MSWLVSMYCTSRMLHIHNVANDLNFWTRLSYAPLTDTCVTLPFFNKLTEVCGSAPGIHTAAKGTGVASRSQGT